MLPCTLYLGKVPAYGKEIQNNNKTHVPAAQLQHHQASPTLGQHGIGVAMRIHATSPVGSLLRVHESTMPWLYAISSLGHGTATVSLWKRAPTLMFEMCV